MEEKILTGSERITREREEQLGKHGITVEMDVVGNTAHQLVVAAANLCYLGTMLREEDINARLPYGWDKSTWHKMMKKPYVERLAIAGALLAAEIDREVFVAKNMRDEKK